MRIAPWVLALVAATSIAQAQNVIRAPQVRGPVGGVLAGTLPNPILGTAVVSLANVVHIGSNTMPMNASSVAASPLPVQLPVGCSTPVIYTSGVTGTPGSWSCFTPTVAPVTPTLTTVIGNGWGSGAVLAWFHYNLDATSFTWAVTVGTAPGTIAAMNAGVAPDGWVCTASDVRTLTIFPRQTSFTTSSAVLTFANAAGMSTAPTAGDTVVGTCAWG